VLLLVIPDLPLWVLFAVLVLVGLLAPPFDAARSALLADILEGDRYVVGNALSGAVSQAGQVAGFVLGGPWCTCSAPAARSRWTRPPSACPRSCSRWRCATAPSPWRRRRTRLRHELTAGVSLVARDPQLRRLLGWGVLIASMTIAPEGLAVSVADGLDRGPALPACSPPPSRPASCWGRGWCCACRPTGVPGCSRGWSC
jgi:MFS family permease